MKDSQSVDQCDISRNSLIEIMKLLEDKEPV